MPVQRHRRGTPPFVRHQVEAQEPGGQGQLGGIEHRARGNRRLSAAAVALPETAMGQHTASVMTTVRAAKSIGPSPPVEGVEALVLGSVLLEKFVQREPLLERHRVKRHEEFSRSFGSPWGASRMIRRPDQSRTCTISRTFEFLYRCLAQHSFGNR